MAIKYFTLFILFALHFPAVNADESQTEVSFTLVDFHQLSPVTYKLMSKGKDSEAYVIQNKKNKRAPEFDAQAAFILNEIEKIEKVSSNKKWQSVNTKTDQYLVTNIKLKNKSIVIQTPEFRDANQNNKMTDTLYIQERARAWYSLLMAKRNDLSLDRYSHQKYLKQKEEKAKTKKP